MRPPEPPRRPSADAPGARAPRPGLPVPKPATLGAEVIDADTFVLWCAANRADAVDAALAEGAYVGANPRTYVATRQELAAERARRLRDEDGGENNVMDAVDAAAARVPPPPPAPGASSRAPPASRAALLCAAAMACAEYYQCAVPCWEFPLLAYEPVVASLKRKSLVDQRYLPRRAAPGVAPTLIPPTTFIALEREKNRAERNRARAGGSQGRSAGILRAPLGSAPRSNSESTTLERLDLLPRDLLSSLYPFQREGVEFGLERGGRCLIADQMGVGKTIQALAIAACYLDEGPILVVVPASMRLTWAREAERWLPALRPKNLVVLESGADAFALRRVREAVRVRRELSDRAIDAVRRAVESREAEDRTGGGSVLEEVGGLEDEASDEDSWLRTMATRRDAAAARESASRANLPRVVVSSYQMAERRRAEIDAIAWGAVIVDESHQLRTTMAGRDRGESPTTEATLATVRRCRRAVLATGTPALTKTLDLFNQVDALRPGAFGEGKDHYDRKRAFMRTYCDLRRVPAPGGATVETAAGGSRQAELNALLTSTVMIRRLKKDVMKHLPPKHRQVVPIPVASKAARRRGRRGEGPDGGSDGSDGSGSESDSDFVGARKRRRRRGDGAGLGDGAGASMSREREVALAKLPGAIEWLREAALTDRFVRERDSPKAILFAHHKDVMDELQLRILDAFHLVDAAGRFANVGALDPSVPESRARRRVPPYVRIDGDTPPSERGEAVDRFRDDPSCRVALVSITAGCVGIDLSAAGTVIFAELPACAADCEQAEDRAHRNGVRNPVNVYYLVARGPGAAADERRWANIEAQLNKLRRAVDGEDLADERGLRPDAFGVETGILERKGTEAGARKRGRDPERVGGSSSSGEDDDDARGREEKDERREEKDEGREEKDDPFPFPSDLWFELSPHTGRAHLHAAADGSAPLAQSVAPGDARRVAAAVRRRASVVAASDAADDEALCDRLRGDPGAILAAAAFLDECDALTAKDRNFLAREHACARSPVAETVARLANPADAANVYGTTLGLGADARSNANRAGPPALVGSRARHGGDARRAPLPEGAEWRPALVRAGGRRVVERREPITAEGELLCLLCMRPRGDEEAGGEAGAAPGGGVRPPAEGAAPPYPDSASLYCSAVCHAVDKQASSASELRRQLYLRERGVCRLCGLDASALAKRLAVMTSRRARREACLAVCPRFGEAGGGALLEALVRTAWEGCAWHFDHVVAVKDGGGECTVENGRTLCVMCHKAHTAEQKKRWAAERRREKKEEEKRRRRDAAQTFFVPASRKRARERGDLGANDEAHDEANDARVDDAPVIELSGDEELSDANGEAEDERSGGEGAACGGGEYDANDSHPVRWEDYRGGTEPEPLASDDAVPETSAEGDAPSSEEDRIIRPPRRLGSTSLTREDFVDDESQALLAEGLF